MLVPVLVPVLVLELDDDDVPPLLLLLLLLLLFVVELVPGVPVVVIDMVRVCCVGAFGLILLLCSLVAMRLRPFS